MREEFVPLRHDPGHAQVDFGEALAVIGGVERKIHFFAMDLLHSDACLVQAYPSESTEAFCEGHNVGFEFFGGVPCSILYDNLKLAVARGMTQTIFAVESAMDELARSLKMDPYEFRRLNVVKPDDPMIAESNAATDTEFGSYGLDQCIDLVQAAMTRGNGVK